MSENENSLSRGQQMNGIVVLLATTGLMWFGFFMLIPLLAVHITRDLALGATIAGLVLAVRQFTQFGLGLFASALADWAGYRRMIMLGMLIRAVGFGWLAWAGDTLSLTLAAAVSAVGGALFESSSKAALAALSKGFKRETIFSLSSTAGNLGMSTGPLLGVALIKVDFALVGMIAAGIYLLDFLLVWLCVPPIAQSKGVKSGLGQMFSNLGTVWHDGPFVLITVLLVGYYSLYSQINITLPLEATNLTGSEDGVSLLYIVNSGLAISLQFVALRYLARRVNPVTIIGVGTLVSALGLFLISFVGSYWPFIACVVVYALGRLVVEPTVAVIVTNRAQETTLASYFGFSSLALGFGGIFGSLLGGWLFDFGRQIGLNGLCWWVFGGMGLAVMIGALLFRRSNDQLIRPQEVNTFTAKSAGLEASTASPASE